MSQQQQQQTTMNDKDLDEEELKSLFITSRDVAPMFGSLLSFADVKTETKKVLTKNWWNIISTWYPNMLTEIYCVPPVHFYAVTYKPKEDKPNLQEPYERFGMRLYLPMQQTKVVDDEAQQRVLATFLSFAKKKGLVCFVLSNVEFQNYLNKSYETAPGDDVKPPRGIPPTNEEGEVDVMVIDKDHGVFLLEVKGTGYRHTDDMSEEDKLKDLPAPLKKIIRQLPSQKNVVRYILDDLDPPGQQKIKIRLGFLFPNLQKQLLTAALVKEQAIQEDLMKAIGATSLDQLLNCCLCLDDMPPKDTVPVNVITSENYNRIDKFWSTLQDVSGKMVSPIDDGIYQQLVARFCGHLTTVKIYTERTMPRVKLEKIHAVRKTKKKCRSQGQVKEIVIPWECRNTPASAREMARRFSELVLLPKQIELLNLEENFVHIEGPPGTGKTLMLLLRVLTWLDGNNMVWMLSLAPPSRSIIHVLYEQVKQMLNEHKGIEAKEILKKRLRVFIMTRPEKTLDAKYFERRLHKWRLRAKLKDSEINWGYPRPPTLPPVAPLSDRKVCLVLDETGMTGKGLKAFFDQVSVCHKEGCFTNNEVGGFTAGLSVWSASVEKCGRPGYARKTQENETKDKFGVYWKLTLPLRCPPSVQRALMLVQPQLDEKNVFLFRKGDVLPTPVSPQKDGDPCFNYHADGLPVYLIAHGGHKKADQPIWLCRECGADLAGYLKDTLQIGEDESEVSGQPLMQKDVLIVATHGAYDKYISVGGFFYSLHKKRLKVGISTTREEGDSALSGQDVILVADITSVHGLERAVVVVVPEHPNHPPPAAKLKSAQTQGGEKMDVDNSEQAEVMSSPVQGGSPQLAQGEVIMDTTDKDDTDEEPDAATGNTEEEEMPESHHDTTNKVLQKTEYNTSAASPKQMEAEECEADSAQQPSSPGKRGPHYTDPHSESEIEAALKTLPERAQKDVFYIGSRAVCQLIIIHFGNGKKSRK